MWGGRFNPMLVVDDAAFADRLIKLYRVDALAPASYSEQVQNLIDGYEYLPWPLSHQEFFVGGGNDGKSATVADLIHPIFKVYEDSHKHNPAAGPSVDLYEWDADDPLADVFLCTYGGLPAVDECGIDYAELMCRHLAAERKVIANGAELPRPDPSRMTLSALGRAFIEQHYVVRNYRDSPGFYVGEADNFDDLVTYWNLRAADVPVHFHDARYAARTQPLREEWLSVLPKFEPRRSRLQGVALWHRREFEIGDRNPFGDSIIDCGIDEYLWNGLNIQAPFMHFGEGSSLAAVDSSSGKTTVSFALTDKPFFKDWAAYHQHFVISVDPGVGLIQNERETLHTPFIPELNEYYGRQCYFSWNHARAEPESLGIVQSVTSDHITLRGLDVGELIGKIFANVGIEAAPSKAGLVATSLIRQMGGLSGCRPFKIAGVRSLIERHRPNQAFSRSEAMQTIRGQNGDRPLDDYQWLHIEPRKVNSPLKNADVLGYLLDRGVFRPGLKFDCPSCLLEFWRSLDEANSEAECEYCGHRFSVARQLRDKDWAFRRSGLFGRDDNQEGAIPVTLTLQQLMRMHMSGEGIYTTAMTLRPSEADIPPCETDFVIVTSEARSRRIQVVIGECKTRGPITEDDVRKLAAVADAFPDNYDVFVVFARLTPFKPEEIDLIRPLNKDWRQRAIILTERELEPYFIYERTAEEFAIERSAVSFKDMATVTEQVFFQNLRKEQPSGS